MLLFCPSCSNVLTVSLSNPPPNSSSSSSPSPSTPQNRLECRTCPYEYFFTTNRSIFERRYFKHKEVEDVFGGPAAWNDAQKTKVQCDNRECEGMEAAFFQVQIRSADEPMTVFYKCMTCEHRWRD